MRRLHLAAVLAILTGCEYYERPNRPLPRDFSATTLAGQALRGSDLRGKPWVIALWVPG